MSIYLAKQLQAKTGITSISGGSVSNNVLTLPSGGGGSYDDTNVRALIAANTIQFVQTRPQLTQGVQLQTVTQNQM